VGVGRCGRAGTGPRRNGEDELELEFRSGVDNNVYGEKDVRHLWDPQTGKDLIWESLREEAADDAAREPLLSGFLHGSVLSHSNFEQALAAVLAQRLASRTLLATAVRSPALWPRPPHPRLPPLSLHAHGKEKKRRAVSGTGAFEAKRGVVPSVWRIRLPAQDLRHGTDVRGLLGGGMGHAAD
jgi:hypothetical protein